MPVDAPFKQKGEVFPEVDDFYKMAQKRQFSLVLTYGIGCRVRMVEHRYNKTVRGFF